MTKFILGIATLVDIPLWRLAQGGEPEFVHDIFDGLVDVKENGSIKLHPDYFSIDLNDRSTALALNKFFDTKKGESESIEKFQANLARSTQFVICSVIVEIAKHARELSGHASLCVSGLLAIDPDVQEALVDAGIFENIWFQPLNGNVNSALGAGLLASFEYFDISRNTSQVENISRTSGPYGPEYAAQEIDAFVDTFDYPSEKYCVEEQAVQIASMIAEGSIVGHFAGRLGVSPECMGDRLILSRLGTPQDPRSPLAVSHGTASYFEPTIAIADKSPFSNSGQCWEKFTISPVSSAFEITPPGTDSCSIYDWKENTDSQKGTVWVRATHKAVSPRIHKIVKRMEMLTGCAAVAIAPFSQPVSGTVCTPLDAYRIFMTSNMDVLVLGEHILLKSDQPPWPDEPLIRPDNEICTIGVAQKKLYKTLDQLFNRKWMSALLEVHVANAIDPSSAFESPAETLVSEVPPELERNRVARRIMAEILGRGYEAGPRRELYQEMVFEIVRLNRVYYKGYN